MCNCWIYKYGIQYVGTGNTSRPRTLVCTSGVQSINTKYKMYALEIRLTLGPVCLQLLPHFTAFYGHSPQLSGFPEFFNNSHNVHKRLIVVCTSAFFNTSSNLFCFFQGRVNRVPIYCDSWHNVDILIVVTMLNVDAWRRSSVGWQNLSPSMQSTDCSPFHYPPHICIGFCSYLLF